MGIFRVTNHSGHQRGSQWRGGWRVYSKLDVLIAMQQTIFQLDASSGRYC